MATYQLYAGDGSNRNFSVPFPYLDKSHVTVKLNEVETGAFTWLSGASIQMTTAPAAGVVVDVRRVTPTGTPPVDFTDGSILSEAELDLVAVYSAYLSEESGDVSKSALRENHLGQLDARGLRIINVAPGVSPGDAVNKSRVDAVAAVADAALVAAANAADYANFLMEQSTQIAINMTFPLDLGLVADITLHNQFDLGTL